MYKRRVSLQFNICFLFPERWPGATRARFSRRYLSREQYLPAAICTGSSCSGKQTDRHRPPFFITPVIPAPVIDDQRYRISVGARVFPFRSGIYLVLLRRLINDVSAFRCQRYGRGRAKRSDCVQCVPLVKAFTSRHSSPENPIATSRKRGALFNG